MNHIKPNTEAFMYIVISSVSDDKRHRPHQNKSQDSPHTLCHRSRHRRSKRSKLGTSPILRFRNCVGRSHSLRGRRKFQPAWKWDILSWFFFPKKYHFCHIAPRCPAQLCSPRCIVRATLSMLHCPRRAICAALSMLRSSSCGLSAALSVMRSP